MPDLTAQSWTRTSIDERSHIDLRSPQGQPHVLVFIHGIFGSSQSTWQETPNALKRLDTLSTFDFAFFGYRSSYVEIRLRSNLSSSFESWRWPIWSIMS